MKLYHGARQVAEAVSCYMCERASRHEARQKKLEIYKIKMDKDSTSDFCLKKEPYDDVSKHTDLFLFCTVFLQQPTLMLNCMLINVFSYILTHRKLVMAKTLQRYIYPMMKNLT